MADTGAPLRGADPVNDELEVGFNSDFERRWHRYELAGRMLLAIIVAAGLAGLLGSGPLSHRSAIFHDGSITRIDFEPIARFGTPTQITFHIKPSAGAPVPQGHSDELTLSSNYVEPFGLQETQPEALQSTAYNGNVVLTILTRNDGKDDLVRVKGQPSQAGPIELTARFNGETPVKITQFVLP